MSNNWRRFTGAVLLLYIVALALMGCNSGLPESAQTATVVAQIDRAVEQTVSFIITQTALAIPTSTPTNTLTPSLTFTPTTTYTPSNTFTPSATFTASNTFTPTATHTATFTPTRTPTASRTPRPTSTPLPSNTPTQTVVPADESSQSTGTAYRTLGSTRVRSCANTTCGILTTIPANALVEVLSTAAGASVSGNTDWYEIVLDGGQTGFIHSSLARRGSNPVVFAQPAQPTSPPVNAIIANTASAGGSNVSTAEPMTSIPATQPGSQWTCAGDQYNCGDFSNRQHMLSYWNACPGDPSRLDGDDDGDPCESLR